MILSQYNGLESNYSTQAQSYSEIAELIFYTPNEDHSAKCHFIDSWILATFFAAYGCNDKVQNYYLSLGILVYSCIILNVQVDTSEGTDFL